VEYKGMKIGSAVKMFADFQLKLSMIENGNWPRPLAIDGRNWKINRREIFFWGVGGVNSRIFTTTIVESS
jgi:hypothetical protein